MAKFENFRYPNSELDVQETSNTSGKFYFYDCRFNNALNVTGNNPVQQYEAQSCHFFSTNTIQGATVNYIGCSLAGLTVTSSSAGGASTSVTLNASDTYGNISITQTCNTMSAAFYNSAFTSGCTLTTSGTVGLTVDCSSLPIKADQTLSGGTTITYVSDATALAYTPTTSGNWPSAPATVQAALDDIAAGNVFVAQQKIVYVGKHGSDSNSGLSLQLACLTFNHASSVANGIVSNCISHCMHYMFRRWQLFRNWFYFANLCIYKCP